MKKPTKAKLLIGKKVHINTDLLDEQEEEFDWQGFEVIDHLSFVIMSP